jgi:RimJ/RimL family protein N-acetyltransferase
MQRARRAMEPPRVIETVRLRLRPPVEADIEAIFEYGSDVDVSALMDWRRLTRREEAAEFVDRTLETWRLGKEFTWVITEIRDDFVIGATSIRVRDADADFGYVLNQRYWGQGLATEAAGSVVSWAAGVPGLARTWATCDTENYRSMRVLEKLGLVREGLAPKGIVRPNISEHPRSSFVYMKSWPAVELGRCTAKK